MQSKQVIAHSNTHIGVKSKAYNSNIEYIHKISHSNDTNEFECDMEYTNLSTPAADMP